MDAIKETKSYKKAHMRVPPLPKDPETGLLMTLPRRDIQQRDREIFAERAKRNPPLEWVVVPAEHALRKETDPSDTDAPFCHEYFKNQPLA